MKTKRFLSYVLTLALLLGMVPWTVLPARADGDGTADSPWQIGTTGHESEVTAVLAGGVLTVSGSGDMADFKQVYSGGVLSTTAPWYAQNASITAIAIDDDVTSVGAEAFDGCKNLTTLDLGGVTTVGAHAFSRCTGLTTLDLSGVRTLKSFAFNWCTDLTTLALGGVTTIGNDAFHHCSGLETIDLGQVQSIEAGAFFECTGLTSVTIPASVTEILGNPFPECESLTSLSVAEGNTAYRIDENGFLLSADGKTLLYCPNGKTGALTIPAGVETVGHSAFRDCTGLTGTLVIPADVTTIGDFAFYGCSGLTGPLTVPDSVTSIGGDAFYYCTGITDVTVGSGVATIGGGAFTGCSALKTLRIEGDGAARSIEFSGGSFSGGYNLETVTFGNGVGMLRGGTFASTGNIKTIVLSTTTDVYYGALGETGSSTVVYYYGGKDYSAPINSWGVNLSNVKPYRILTLGKTEGGTVAASSGTTPAMLAAENYILSGDTVTLTVEPDFGYALTGVSLNGEALEPTDGVYSFDMSADADAEVTVSFTPVEVREWSSNSSLPAESGYYRLTTDVTLTSTWEVSGEITLDLNDHGILRTGNGRIATVTPNASLTLLDGAENKTTRCITLGAFTDRGKFRGTAVGTDAPEGTEGVDYLAVSGGYLTGGSVTEGSEGGGAVLVASGGAFTLRGGTVCGNGVEIAGGSGGGVYVYDGGTFDMRGGTIRHNFALGGGGAGSGGAFTMRGTATIEGNTAGSNGGGGVYVNGGTFTMSGAASIEGNTAVTNGGGVNAKYGAFRVSGGARVTDNTKTAGGDTQPSNVYLPGGKYITVAGTLSSTARIGLSMSSPGAFTNTDAENTAWNVSARFRSDKAAYTVVKDETTGQLKLGAASASVTDGSGTVNFGALQDALDAAAAGDTVTLLADVTTDSAFSVTSGTAAKPVTLDLNGHGVTADTSNGNSTSLIIVKQGAALKLADGKKDSTESADRHYYYLDINGLAHVVESAEDSNYTGADAAKKGSFTGGFLTGGSAVPGIIVYGTLELSAGTIVGNETYGMMNGGSVCVAGGGTFTMTGGTIGGNTVHDGGQGAGVCVADGGTFNMTGGTIGGNTAYNTYGGGGVYVNAGGKLTVGGSASIADNTAKNCPGGGVYLVGTLKMEGGEIRGNTASGNGGGGGVYVYGGTLNMTGGTIDGNTALNGIGGGVYL
ncbi:MAG: leucine-rich repeat domain-containing protein, partial [Ruminococcaceae bacterium]|nr:leucine-rich repeat domain-containing protein [Oscillospiraceae bacterium]